MKVILWVLALLVLFGSIESASAESNASDRRYEEMTASKKKSRAPATSSYTARATPDSDPRTPRPEFVGVPETIEGPGVPVLVVDLRQQVLVGYYANGLQMAASTQGTSIPVVAPISSGKSGYDTPTGAYRVAELVQRHWSKKWEAWMPYSIFFDHGADGKRLHDGHALHLGNVRYARASHGCVRVQGDWARFIYEHVATPYRAELFIVIVNDINDPEELEHMFTEVALRQAIDAGAQASN